MALPPLRIEISADPTQAVAGLEAVQAETVQTGNAVATMGKKIRATNDNFRAARSSSRRFGGAIQNTSYQVQDLAVQLTSGTNATVALSQQLPQLLGGFGMMGAVIGGVVAIVGLLVTQLDTTDSALRRVAISMGLLSARSASESKIVLQGMKNDLAELERQMGANERGSADFEERMRRQAASMGKTGQAVEDFVKRAVAARQKETAENEDFARRAKTQQEQEREQLREQIANSERLIKLREEETRRLEALEDKADGRNKRRKSEDASDKPSTDLRVIPTEGGESSGAAQPVDKAYTMQLQNRLAALEQFQMTEQELLAQRYEQRHATLVDALAQEMLTEQEFMERSKALHQKQAQDIAAIERAKQNVILSQTSSLFGALANIAQQGGKKTAGIAKAFGVAEAIINTYVGATNALRTVPYPANFVAAAAVIANGMASVASIMSVNTNGGSNATATAGGGGGGAAAAPEPLQVTLSGFGPNDLFTGSQLSDLFGKLQDEAGDRGLQFASVGA